MESHLREYYVGHLDIIYCYLFLKLFFKPSLTKVKHMLDCKHGKFHANNLDLRDSFWSKSQKSVYLISTLLSFAWNWPCYLVSQQIRNTNGKRLHKASAGIIKRVLSRDWFNFLLWMGRIRAGFAWFDQFSINSAW